MNVDKFLDGESNEIEYKEFLPDKSIKYIKIVTALQMLMEVQCEDIYKLLIGSVRELIANAICHRSYFHPADVQVAIYGDRLEVTSLGILIKGIKVGINSLIHVGI